MATPHDALFRFTFAQPAHTAGLLRTVLPMELAAAIDWATLRPFSETKTGVNLLLHHTDPLFEARLAGSPVPIFFLLEHKFGPDAETTRQLVRYIVHIVGEWLRRDSLIPHVVPVVVHHGSKSWRGSTWRPRTDVGIDRIVAAQLARLQPRVSYLLDDLTRCSEAELMRREMTALGRLTLLCLRILPRCSVEKALAAIERGAELIRTVHVAQGGHEALDAISSYCLSVTDLPPERLAAAVTRILRRPAEDLVMSTADRLIAKGRTEGRTEGLAEGLAEGRAELLLTLLGKRFGPLADSVLARVRKATKPDLDRWALRLLDAKSLPEVFAAE